MDFEWGNYSVGTVRLTKNADHDKYFFSGYSIWVNELGFLQFPMGMGLVRMLEYSVLIWVHLCMLMIRKRDVLIPDVG